MENRSKFYSGGLWSDDTLQQRFDNIKTVLNIFKGASNAKPSIDKYDLEFAIKNAFVSKIYLSKNVEAAYHKVNRKAIFGRLYNLYETLVNEKVLCLKHGIYNNQNVFFDICKLGDKISYVNRELKKAGKKTLPPIIIEHVVPGKEYMKDVLNLKNGFSKSDYEDISNSICICLVTKEEDHNILNKWKDSMPNNINYKFKPFARYDGKLNGVGKDVAIHGWKLDDGNLVPQP